MFDKWDKLQFEIWQWGKEAFPHANLTSRFAHLEEELLEVKDNPKDISEWADVIILVIGAAKEEGFTMEQLYGACLNKHQINLERVWGNPDSDGVVRHIKRDGE